MLPRGSHERSATSHSTSFISARRGIECWRGILRSFWSTMCFPSWFPRSPGRPTADDLKAARVLTKSTASASPARADQWCVAALAGLVALLAFAYSFFMNRAIYPDELGFYNPIYIRHKYEGMRATLM